MLTRRLRVILTLTAIIIVGATALSYYHNHIDVGIDPGELVAAWEKNDTIKLEEFARQNGIDVETLKLIAGQLKSEERR